VKHAKRVLQKIQQGVAPGEAGAAYLLLSYPITDRVPAWPESPQLRLEKCSRIDRGDAANTYMISLYNHTGTHYDAPNHFLPEGPQIAGLPLSRFIFERPLLLDIPKGDHEKVLPGDLTPHREKIGQCDLLMIRTGFSRFRAQEPDRYEAEGPAIGSECAEYLVSHYQNIQALAVDFVSIASYRDQTDGNRTHQILLGGKGGHFICAVEDVYMAELRPGRIKRVFVLPLLVAGVDSAPVTIVAELT
jgi:kynurenine formamidase